MGIASDGQICYGIAFDEEYPFPWLDDWDEPEEWWIYGVCKYKAPFELYTKLGEYIDGIKPTEEKRREYYKHYRDFSDKHPMPVEVVMHCTYEYPMFIIAAIGTLQTNSRGDVEALSIPDISYAQDNAIIDFCKKYCRPIDDIYALPKTKQISGMATFPEMKPKWLLSSMMG